MGKQSTSGQDTSPADRAVPEAPYGVDPAQTARRRRVKLAIRLVLLAVAAALLLWAVSASAWMVAKIRQWDVNRGTAIKQAAGQLTPRQPGAPFYMVIMGEDKRPGEKVGNSDTLMVAYVDPSRKHITILSIPRDSRVPIPGHGTNKINAAALIGGPALTIQTVRQFTGLPISHYVVVDFNGFRALVNAIGGVVVNVPQRIDDPKASNHVPAATVIERGTQRLNGDQALTFVRSRAFPNGDFTRIKDQQIFLKALAAQTLRPGNIFNLPKVVDAVETNVVSDLSISQMVGLAGDFRGMGSGAVTAATIPGEPKTIGGVAYVIPDTTALTLMVQRVEAGLPPTGRPTARPNASGAGGAVLPSSITVTVSNGARRTGLAKQAAAQLRAAGFRILSVGNTSRSHYAHTLVVYKTSAGKASAVRDRLQVGTIMAAPPGYRFSSDVLVIIGTDWPK